MDNLYNKRLTWHFPIVVVVLGDASTAESQPPRVLPLVVDLEVVDTVRRHRLNDGHVVDDGLASSLAFGLLVVLDHLVFAESQRRMLFQNSGWQDGALLDQVPGGGSVREVTMRRLENRTIEKF